MTLYQDCMRLALPTFTMSGRRPQALKYILLYV